MTATQLKALGLTEETAESLKGKIVNAAMCALESNANCILAALHENIRVYQNKVQPKITLTVEKSGTHFDIDVTFEVERKVKVKDSIETISYDPDQPELFQE